MSPEVLVEREGFGNGLHLDFNLKAIIDFTEEVTKAQLWFSVFLPTLWHYPFSICELNEGEGSGKGLKSIGTRSL